MMTDQHLHRLILDAIMTGGGTGLWLLDAFRHLIKNGATKSEATRALDKYVDEMNGGPEI